MSRFPSAAARPLVAGPIFVALALVAGISGAPAQAPASETIEVSASPITRFRLGSSETRFGVLEFVGGFEMSAAEHAFGQLSALRFLTPGGSFIGVADHGYWFFGRIERDADQVPVGVGDFRMQAMVDETGVVVGAKEKIDAEGLDVSNGIATVSFEREARVSEYAIEPQMAGPLRDLDFLVPSHELRFNRGLETVVRTPRDSVHEGGRIVIAERSIDPAGNVFAAILEGPGKGVFTVRRSDGFDITDGAFLPDGDLLLLERRFSIAQGVAMRLRRIEEKSIREGGLADGPVLMEADLAYQIDNMEAMDVWRRSDGATMVSLMSDDNQSFLQRSIYLEFRLAD